MALPADAIVLLRVLRARQGSPQMNTHTSELKFRLVSDAHAATALQATLAHLRANLEPLRQGQDPEAVHQVHIALQHFRTTLRIFAL
jgi:hypothetical protein